MQKSENQPDPRPFLSIWFGNFFEPFYSDREAVRAGIAEVADLGFNSINLDSKAWEDFFARYRGEPASPYVAMHEFMMEEMAKHGLDYTHLALYLCGDNLYPNIRDVASVRGEEPMRPNGQPMGTYKYWSPRAQQTMVDHVRGLLKLYGRGMRRSSDGRIIMQTMFEPIPKPSFDAEGKQKYLAWLEKRYEGDIAKLNRRYGLAAKSFAELQPAEYWLRPEELNWVGCARPTAADFANRTADFHRWVDNQSHLADVLDEYLATMKRRWRELEPRLFIEPLLHQWGYFFNPPGQVDWQTGQRALDIYRCAAHVDSVLYIAAPLNAENRADAMALSVESSIMRNANSHRPFTAGLYLGRHVNGDIYRAISPAEAIATHIANGAKGFHIYGYSGLDDGGVMYRMDDLFKDSLRAGNRWAAEVIPLLDQPRAKEVAILFPAEMSLYEPLEVDTEGRHRMDLLGWYAQFIDLGWQVDILHPTQIAAGALAGYKHLIAPHNSLYELGDNTAVETAVKKFVAEGGTFFHGPHCELARRAFNIEEEIVDFDCIQWTEEIIPHGWSTVAYPGGQAVGAYIKSGKPGIAQFRCGTGRVISFGFQYGYAYSRRTMPIVPPNYGRREMHPVMLLKTTPIAALAGASPRALISPIKGVEFGHFGNQVVIVNHRPSPVDIRGIAARNEIAQAPTASGWLAAHSATYLEINRDIDKKVK
ncbi:MAG TPA: hypothetical protein VHC44_00240 [Verrucomicrobiae bacterium]|nr:hypothetical protein [Verrucomicrobiae bacterium]